MKSDNQKAADLLGQMGLLAIPLLPPQREARRHERTASAVNLLSQRLSGKPEPRRLTRRALGAVAAVGASVGALVRRTSTACPRSMLPGTPRGARVVALNGLKVPE